MRILRAYGPADNDGQNFNWCDKDEIVNVDGFVCCSSKTCGCNRSFIGVGTRRGTTRAVICEDNEQIFAEVMATMYKKATEPQDVIGRATVLMNLGRKLEQYKLGDVLSVNLDDEEPVLTLVNVGRDLTKVDLDRMKLNNIARTADTVASDEDRQIVITDAGVWGDVPSLDLELRDDEGDTLTSARILYSQPGILEVQSPNKKSYYISDEGWLLYAALRDQP